MGRIKRENYIFVTYCGDHDPRHVHIFKDTKEVAKWDLENMCLMKGKMNKKLMRIVCDLIKEKKL